MKSVLVAVDHFKGTDSIVEKAAVLASAAACKLWLLYVAPPEPDMFGQQIGRKVVTDDVPESLADEYAQLSEIVTGLRRRGIDAEPILVRGNAVDCILEEARIHDVEFIVLGARGRGTLYRALVGSVSEGVLRGSSCPVLIVPSKAT